MKNKRKMQIEILRRIFIDASMVFPESYKERLRESLRYAGMDMEPEIWLGGSLILGIFVFVVISSISRFGNPLFFYTLAVIAFVIYLISSYYIPYFIAFNRADSVENCLPNALQLMASNIRAGMTPFQAMKFSTREEFGLLKDELNRATARALGMESFTDALLNMTGRIKLPSLERSIRLFSRCIESGGPLARVMEETAEDIHEMQTLKKEIMLKTQTYALLILFAVVVGAPLLLTISIYFMEKLAEMKSSFEMPDVEGLEMLVGEAFTPEFLTDIAMINIVITSLIAGLLIGVIKEGREEYGLKYAAFLVPLTLIVFYIMRYVIRLIMI